MISCELIKLARKSTGLSQADFAFRVEVSKRTFQKWEQGIVRPNADDFLKCINLANPEILKIIKKMLE